MLASSCFSWVLLVSDECVAQHLSFTDTCLELVVSRWKRVMDHCPIHEGSEECRGKSPLEEILVVLSPSQTGSFSPSFVLPFSGPASLTSEKLQ